MGAVALDSGDLLRIVRQDAQVLHAEGEEDLGADAIVPQIGAEPESVVGLQFSILAAIARMGEARVGSRPDDHPEGVADTGGTAVRDPVPSSI